MPETVRRKVVESGTTKAALETAKLFVQPAVHTAISASDILLTGGLAIPAEWAVKKLVRRAQGIQEMEFKTPLGIIKLTGKFRTLPDGRRVLIKKIDEVVTKPSILYGREKKRRNMILRARRRYAR
jgi:hypothetical protein